MSFVIGDLLRPVLDRLPMRLPKSMSGPLLLRRQTSGIGLDLGPDRLNMVQMATTAGRVHVHAMASLSYPCPRDALFTQPGMLRELIKQAFSMQAFKGKKVVSCLPAEHIKIITVSFKPADGQTDAAAVVSELRERMQGDLSDTVVDFMTLRQNETDGGKREALVALAPRSKVVAYLDLLTGAGLDVTALDIGPAALARLVCHAGAVHTPEFPHMPNVLLINFGVDSSYVTVIWGRRLMLDRSVDFSEKALFSRLKQVLGMPEELAASLLYASSPDVHNASGVTRMAGHDEASQMVADVLRPEMNQLLQEINKTLVYMASKTRGKSVDQVYLAGRVARYPGLRKALVDQLQVPVELLDPLAAFPPESDGAIDSHLGLIAGMALTTGLALRGEPCHE
jgi:type IV pilus assembly protein PilM